MAKIRPLWLRLIPLPIRRCLNALSLFGIGMLYIIASPFALFGLTYGPFEDEPWSFRMWWSNIRQPLPGWGDGTDFKKGKK